MIDDLTALKRNRSTACREPGAFRARRIRARMMRNVLPLRDPPNNMMWVAPDCRMRLASCCLAVRLKPGVVGIDGHAERSAVGAGDGLGGLAVEPVPELAERLHVPAVGGVYQPIGQRPQRLHLVPASALLERLVQRRLPDAAVVAVGRPGCGGHGLLCRKRLI